MKVVILASARKHGIATEDMLHAYRNPIQASEVEDGWLIIGSDRDGNLIEVGCAMTTKHLRIFHAMKLNPKNIR
ncbi:MAG: hypothetical protein EBV51_07260 [Acidimicrobiia bacterium]|nr:hypothetical protein [Acidimicrobiia bacterium]